MYRYSFNKKVFFNGLMAYDKISQYELRKRFEFLQLRLYNNS